MTFDPQQFAASLRELRHSRTRIEPQPGAPSTEAEGAAAQHALARLIAADPPAGFKIGATGKRMQEFLGIATPVAGFMEARNLHPSSATLRFEDLHNPGAECEIAVRLGRDLPPGPCTPEQAADAVSDLMAAMEIVENRYGELQSVGIPTLVADQMFHAGAVTGALAANWRSLDLARLPGRLLLNGEEQQRGVSGDLLGHPMNCLAWLAGSEVAKVFGGLRAGQLIMLGSVTPPLFLSGPGKIEVIFDQLPPVALTLQ